MNKFMNKRGVKISCLKHLLLFSCLQHLEEAPPLLAEGAEHVRITDAVSEAGHGPQLLGISNEHQPRPHLGAIIITFCKDLYDI